MIDETVTFSIPVADPLTAVLICDLLWMNGVQGVEEIDIDGESVLLRSSFGTTEADTLQRLSDLFGDWSPSLQWEISRVDPSITDSWKQFAQTIEITPSLRIVPAWLPQPNERSNALEVVIDPGATFGMGDHPTTRGSLSLVSKRLQSGGTILDVGCGSGVLGISALLLGARRAQGIDINPASVEVSRANASRNGVDGRWSVSLDSLDTLSERFDLIVANILAPVLIELAEDLVRLLGDEGTLVISGVLRDRYDHVVKALSPLAIVDSIDVEGWTSLALRR